MLTKTGYHIIKELVTKKEKQEIDWFSPGGGGGGGVTPIYGLYRYVLRDRVFFEVLGP